MADYQLRARIPNELADEVKEIAETINTEVPGAEATISTIARYALQDYTRKFDPRIKGETLFLEIPVKGLEKNQLEVVLKALKDIQSVSPTVGKEIEQVENKVLDFELQELITKRKLKGGEK